MTKGDRIETNEGKSGIIVRGPGGLGRREIKILIDGETIPRTVQAVSVFLK